MGSIRPAARNQRAKLAADLNDLFKDLQSSQVKVVGNYHLGKVIGQGTYGKVKLATHALTGQVVAIKIVAKAHAAILTREIYHWRGLNHANIAHLHEVLTTESKIYLVTEYCPNGELLDALIRDGRCRPGLAKKWFRQICSALQYCHGRKIVHRDLKLENILLDHRNNIKLIDFGFTRECESKKLLESYCGSAAYTSPEIILGKKYSGPEADIWSLGVILYTLLAGYLPFDDDNEKVVQDKIVALDYEMPPDLFPSDAQDLIAGILRSEPKVRLSIDQILSHVWWAPQDTDNDPEEGEVESDPMDDPTLHEQGPHHGRQGSLTKREIHPVNTLTDSLYGTSPQLPSPLVQPQPYSPWGHSGSAYTFNPTGEGLRAAPGSNLVPSPMSSPLPSPSPMVQKSFPRYEGGNDGQAGNRSSTTPFPSNVFEQRLLMALAKVGFDQEVFASSVPAQSCDPGYGLWCLLVDKVRQRAADNGTTVEWEQSIALLDPTVAGSGAIYDSGKRSPRPMSDPSPSSSQTNLALASSTLHQHPFRDQPYQLDERQDLHQQTLDLKHQLDQSKLDLELLRIQKDQLEKEKALLNPLTTAASASGLHPLDGKPLPGPVQDSGVSVSTSSTPNSSWELAERDVPVMTPDRPRRKSKGLLTSIKDRFFHNAATDPDATPSPSPSPVPPRHIVALTGSASSSASSAITYALPSKPLPAPPAHPYPNPLPHLFPVPAPSTPSPLGPISFKSASTSSLVLATSHAASVEPSQKPLPDQDSSMNAGSPSKRTGFMTWITDSASGTVLNKTPVVQSSAKVTKRLNSRSFTAEPTTILGASTEPEDTRPKIPAIPASFFQPIWKSNAAHASTASLPSTSAPPSVLATSAPSMSIRQRLASFSSAKISSEERQRAAAAAATAAALVSDSVLPQAIALPERAHSPSPPSSPRGSDPSAFLASQQAEISGIVAAAVAATANANLSSGSRKKTAGTGKSKKIPKSESSTRRQTESSTKQSAPSLQIPSPTTDPLEATTCPKDAKKKSPSLNASKAAMPSIMTAFSSASSAFKASRSAPSSPVVRLSVSDATAEPLQQSQDSFAQPSRPEDSQGTSQAWPAVTSSNPRHAVASTSTATSVARSSKESRRAFDDGVVVQDETRPKKRTTSRTSITAASLSRPSTESVASLATESAENTERPTVDNLVKCATVDTPSSTIAPALPPSKRASLGSISSRRSSSSSTRDRNIFGLTLDSSGTGSRKSSLNLSRPSLSMANFHSPSVSPVQPRRGQEMERDRQNGTPSTERDLVELQSQPISTKSAPDSDLQRECYARRALPDVPVQDQARAGEKYDSIQDRQHDSTAVIMTSSATPSSKITNTITLSASLSASTLMSQEGMNSPVQGGNTQQGEARVASRSREQSLAPSAPSGEAISVSTDEDPFNATEAPRLDFAEGCSLIPSPPPSPSPVLSIAMGSNAICIRSEPSRSGEPSRAFLTEPKSNLLSTSFPPPRTSLSYTPTSTITMGQGSSGISSSPSPPSPSRPLVSFDQHFSNPAKDFRDGTPRQVVNGFQPLAAKRLSKPGAPSAQGSEAPGSVGSATTPEPMPEIRCSGGPPNAFAGRRRGYRNSTGSMSNMTLQQQQNFQQLQQEQLLKLQQNQPNAGYEATAAMKLNPRPRTGLFPKREYGGVALGGLGGPKAPSSPGLGSMDHGFGGASMETHGGHAGSSQRDSYSSRRQSMAVAMGKRPGAAPAAIQEEEE